MCLLINNDYAVAYGVQFWQLRSYLNQRISFITKKHHL